MLEQRLARRLARIQAFQFGQIAALLGTVESEVVGALALVVALAFAGNRRLRGCRRRQCGTEQRQQQAASQPLHES
ncbi:hypothetical protein D3C81_2068610 [compost metagenome]